MASPAPPYLNWQMTPPPEPQQPIKSSRARLVHPAHSRLPGCDICRQRRTKCVRLDPDDPTCKSCKARNVPCTTIRSGGIRYKQRKPRNAAPPPTGEPESPAETEPSSALTAAATTEAGPSYSGWKQEELEQVLALAKGEIFAPSDSTPEGRLSLTEESESVLGGLLDSYLSHSSWSVPLLAWSKLRERFERAGRRPAQLDLMTETLVLAGIALGAYHTDDPHVVGLHAPRLHDLQSLGRHNNLSTWGRRRQAFCHRLVEQVIRQVDRSSCFRIACTESVASLGLTAELISHSHGSVAVDLMRPYYAAANCHLRFLADCRDAGNDLRSLADITLAVEDALTSAILGRALLWSDEDLECILKFSEMRPLSLEALARDLAAGRNDVDMTVPWSLATIATRKFAKTISRRVALGQHVDISDFLDALSTSEGLLQHALALHATIRSSWRPVHPDLRYTLDSDPSSHSTAFIMFAATLVLVIRRQFTRWREDRWKHTVQRLDEESRVQEMQAVTTAEETLTRLLAECVTLIGSILMERRNAAGIEVVTHLSSFAPIKLSISKWALMALSLPCAEMGGPLCYPRTTQIQTVRALIDALRAQAWTWGERDDEADGIEAKYQVLLAKWPHATLTAADGPGGPLDLVRSGSSATTPSSWSGSVSELWDPTLFERFARHSHAQHQERTIAETASHHLDGVSPVLPSDGTLAFTLSPLPQDDGIAAASTAHMYAAMQRVQSGSGSDWSSWQGSVGSWEPRRSSQEHNSIHTA